MQLTKQQQPQLKAIVSPQKSYLYFLKNLLITESLYLWWGWVGESWESIDKFKFFPSFCYTHHIMHLCLFLPISESFLWVTVIVTFLSLLLLSFLLFSPSCLVCLLSSLSFFSPFLFSHLNPSWAHPPDRRDFAFKLLAVFNSSDGHLHNQVQMKGSLFDPLPSLSCLLFSWVSMLDWTLCQVHWTWSWFLFHSETKSASRSISIWKQLRSLSPFWNSRQHPGLWFLRLEVFAQLSPTPTSWPTPNLLLFPFSGHRISSSSSALL